MGCCSSNVSSSIPREAPRFTVTGIYEGRITKVHDGDTWRAIFKFRGAFHTFTLRLDGLDTPEIHHSSSLHQTTGYAIRAYLKQFEGKLCKIHCRGTDKYGRVLAVVFYQNHSINQSLLERQWANAYDGRRKHIFSDSMLTLIKDDVTRLTGSSISNFFKLSPTKIFLYNKI